jgi:predicted small lipoprotein YifL
MKAALALAVMTGLTACGQTGSLYLPDETIESPVEIRTTAPPAPADDEKQEKPAEPPDR